jgi:hypothetical protein
MRNYVIVSLMSEEKVGGGINAVFIYLYVEIEKKVLSKIYNRPFIGAIIFYTNKFTRKNNFILC